MRPSISGTMVITPLLDPFRDFLLPDSPLTPIAILVDMKCVCQLAMQVASPRLGLLSLC